MKTSVVQMAEEVPLIPDDGDDGDIELGGWDAFGSLFGNPDQFLQQVLTTAGPVAIRVAIKKLRPKIEPVIKAKGLTWEDVLPALDLVDSVEELEAEIADPDAFLDKLAAIAGPVAIRLLIAKMRPKIEPVVKAKGLTWEDVLPALDLINTAEKLIEGAKDPEAFFQKLLSATSPAAIRLAICKLRSRVEPVVVKQGLTWADVLPALAMIDTMAEVKEAAENPAAFIKTEAFLKKIATVAGPGAVARNAKREKKARSSKISRDERAFAMIGTGAGFASMMAGRFGSESVAAVAGRPQHLSSTSTTATFCLPSTVTNLKCTLRTTAVVLLMLLFTTR